MLDKIIKFSLSNRIAVLFGAVLLTVVGIYTSQTMEVDVFPDLNAPTVVVMTEANGMAADEVEKLVTFPIETAVNGSNGVKRVRSTSTNGFSSVWVEFDWGMDVYKARQIVSEKLSLITEKLPEGIGRPTLGPQSSIMGELMIISLTSDSISSEDLRTVADWEIAPRILSMGGVAQVSVLGGDVKEYQVDLNLDKMRMNNVSLPEVMASLRKMNNNVAGGSLYEFGNEYLIRGIFSAAKTEDLEKVVVKCSDNSTLLLRDVSQIKVGGKTPKTGMASYNSKPAVLMTVTKQSNVSTIGLTEQIENTLEELRSSLPPSVEVNTDAFKQSRFIDSSISNIQKSLFEGAFFVVIVLLLFLLNVRTTVISLVTIPLSLLVSIVTLSLMGLSINTMSIGGMAIAIGSLVDDAIVDVENVHKRLKANRNLPKETQKNIIQVVFDASREVRLPILNSTLIIIVSFLPLFFLTGMEGRMLIPLGIAFIVALFASTVVALTLTPVLCSYLLKNDEGRETSLSLKLRDVYQKALKWTLSHPSPVMYVVITMLLLALITFSFLGRSFLPSFNEGSLTINVSTVPGISLKESNWIGEQAERILMSVPEVKVVARKTGRAELDEHALGINVSEIEVPFELKDRSKQEMITEIREKMKQIPGVAIEIGQPISHRIDAMLSGTEANIAIKIFGRDLNMLFQLGNNAKRCIEEVEGVEDLNVEQQIECPQLKIIPRRDIMAKYGVPMSDFREMISVLLMGEVVGQVYEQERSFDIVVRSAEESRESIEKIKSLLVDTKEGKVPLYYLADVVSTSGPNTINRENVSRKIVVSANVEGRDLRSTVDEIRGKIEREIRLPEGYHIEYGGQFESEQRASRTLLITSIIAILVIFLLLYHQFKNVKQSVAILFNLPLALMGGTLAISLTGGILSIPSIIGFISLFGIATRNGMLLVDRYNELRRSGMTVTESVVQGSLDRLNPILMTALSSAFALIPLALGGDLPGNEIQSPMAKVILGGLFSSTFLNAFVIPIVYSKIENRKGREKDEAIVKWKEWRNKL